MPDLRHVRRVPSVEQDVARRGLDALLRAVHLRQARHQRRALHRRRARRSRGRRGRRAHRGGGERLAGPQVTQRRSAPLIPGSESRVQVRSQRSWRLQPPPRRTSPSSRRPRPGSSCPPTTCPTLGVFDWSASSQSINNAKSSTNCELLAVSDKADLISVFRQLLAELRVLQPRPTLINMTKTAYRNFPLA